MILKHGLDIVYGRQPNYSEVVFGLHNDGYPRDLGIESSRIYFGDELDAGVILGVLGEIIPSYWEHFYDEFLVRPEETRQIVERLKEVREAVRRDPCDPRLGKLVDYLMRSSFALDTNLLHEAEDYDEAKKKSLFRHRYDIVALYDIFIRWMEYASAEGFWVEGP